VKVEKYNDMLEDIYQCEVELSNIKSTLLDMRDQIAAAGKSDSSESNEAEQVLFDSSSGARAAMVTKVAKKIKTKTPATSFASKRELDGEFRHVDSFTFLASRQQHLLRVPCVLSAAPPSRSNASTTNLPAYAFHRAAISDLR
jgi:hypothetical protein